MGWIRKTSWPFLLSTLAPCKVSPSFRPRTLLTFSQANSSRTKHNISQRHATLLQRSILGMAVNGWLYIQIPQHCKSRKASFTRYSNVIPLFLPRLGKPEALTAAAIVTKDHWNSFIPFNETCVQDDKYYGMEALLLFRLSLTLPNSGGVEHFQQDYAFTAWASSASRCKSLYSSSHSHAITPQL